MNDLIRSWAGNLIADANRVKNAKSVTEMWSAMDDVEHDMTELTAAVDEFEEE
jgi:hypothetical protein